MITFDIVPLDDRFADRQGSGDEFDTDRYMRMALQLTELHDIDLSFPEDDTEDDHAYAARH